eukprot:1459286-Prymnesium_polylepis.1
MTGHRGPGDGAPARHVGHNSITLCAAYRRSIAGPTVPPGRLIVAPKPLQPRGAVLSMAASTSCGSQAAQLWQRFLSSHQRCRPQSVWLAHARSQRSSIVGTDARKRHMCSRAGANSHHLFLLS